MAGGLQAFESSGRCGRLTLFCVAVCEHHVTCMSQLYTLWLIEICWCTRLADYGHDMCCLLSQWTCSWCAGGGPLQQVLGLDLHLSKAGFFEAHNTVIMDASSQLMDLTPELPVDLAVCNIDLAPCDICMPILSVKLPFLVYHHVVSWSQIHCKPLRKYIANLVFRLLLGFSKERCDI